MTPTTPGRKASGSVQAEVTDQRSAAQAPDQLKLTKGSVASASAAAAEEKIAKARQAQETAARTAELSRNIEALAKVDAAGAQPAPAAGQPAEAPKPATPGIPVTAAVATSPAATATPPTPPVEPAQGQAPAAPAATAEATTAAASPAATSTAAPPAAPAPAETAATPAEPGFLDDLMDNPLVLPAAGGLIAILLGLVAYRLRKPKKNNGIDSSYLESRLQPDSFFGASGGQTVDTAEAPVTGSSLMYSPSQLDAGGDVDPVAEADVYLAYGRDLQAEEILKEAMRLNPTRVAVHSKMLEIYAKRRDLKSFDILATEIYTLTQGSGPVWEHARELGISLFPDNPLYQPGGATDGLLKDPADHAAPGGSEVATTVPNTVVDDTPHDGDYANTDHHADALDLDLDLDFSIDTPDEPQMPATAGVPPSAALLPDLATPPEDQGLTFDLSAFDAFDAFPPPSTNSSAASAPAPAAATPPPATDADDFGLTFDLSDLGDMSADPLAAFKAEMANSSATPKPQSTPEPDDFSLHFELPELDSNTQAPTPAAQPSPPPSPPPSPVAQAPQVLPEMDMMAFEMDDRAFDLNGPDTLGDPDGIPDGDPLETKLSLATEFLAIGDEDGARSLAEEVLEQATGSLKAKASTFLSNLG
jgi:pilus assembly protein FimV